MLRFVLDACIVVDWCLQKSTPEADFVLDFLRDGQIEVPACWPLEVTNAISRSVNKKILTEHDATDFFNYLQQFAIHVDQRSDRLPNLFGSARTHMLSTYDASYVDLASRLLIPLATSDKSMKRAAREAGVTVLI